MAGTSEGIKSRLTVVELKVNCSELRCEPFLGA